MKVFDYITEVLNAVNLLINEFLKKISELEKQSVISSSDSKLSGGHTKLSALTAATISSATAKVKEVEEQFKQDKEVMAIYEKFYEKDDNGDFKIPKLEESPVNNSKDEILNRLKGHDVLIVKGETGSGKGLIERT